MLIPVKNSQFKMTCILRCITLLDGSIAQVGNYYTAAYSSLFLTVGQKTFLHRMTRAKVLRPALYLKRKVGVDSYHNNHDNNEGEEGTREKLMRMSIDTQ